MSSIFEGFEYDIFISYRQNDNHSDKWVSNFVNALKEELEATLKNPVSIYFDENPDDGLLETHQVDASLAKKLKCLVFIPIISQTYCDTKSFAWEHEFLAFNKMANEDALGMNITLANGNVTSRVLPIKIHDLDAEDQNALATELCGPLRSIDFIYKELGVNRPLKPNDDRSLNLENTDYQNQINKVANALKKIGVSILRQSDNNATTPIVDVEKPPAKKPPFRGIYIGLTAIIIILLVFLGYTQLNNLQGTKVVDKSIAVLYFDNMSGDPDQEHFSDGITEEIIARLTKVNGLRVISRTSTRVYKGQPLNLKKIAKELNVATVLEGSFRKSGNKIKVTAQLINAETDEHIWAETFDKELIDIFQVQTEIAHEIAKKFEIDITTEVDLMISEIPTNNSEAYDYFLRGKHITLTQYHLQREDTAIFNRAKKQYETAIMLDSGFAEAYAGLGDLYDEKRNKNNAAFPAELDSLRHALSNKAIAMAPNSSWVNNTRAWTFLNRENRELDSGFYYLKRALELDPNDPENMSNLAGFYSIYLGLGDQGQKLHTKALELDPLNPRLYRGLSGHAWRSGDYKNWYRFKVIEDNLRGNDDYFSTYRYVFSTNNLDHIQKEIDSIEAEGISMPYSRAVLQARKGEKEELKSLIKNNNINNFELYLLSGMKEEAIDWLFKYYQDDPTTNFYSYLKNNPFCDPYREDDDFIELLDSAKLKHDAYLNKYGSYVDEFLKTHN